MRSRKTVCALMTIVGLLCAPGLALAQNAPAAPPIKTIGVPSSAKAQIVPSLIVMNSRGASLQGQSLTLTGVSPNSIVFADRPVRAAGHAITASLLDEWAGNDSFGKDPPNATVSVLNKDGSSVRDVVVVLKSPKMDGDKLTFDVQVLGGRLGRCRRARCCFHRYYWQAVYAAVICRRGAPNRISRCHVCGRGYRGSLRRGSGIRLHRTATHTLHQPAATIPIRLVTNASAITIGVIVVKTSHLLISVVGVLALSCASALAQQVTGVPGSPEATTTIDGKQLPPPPPNFGGVIEERASQSKPWWPPRVVPPKGAPNVLLIMTDDQGFGAPSTFGGVIPTPTMDRIAAAGLRYTNFHSTSLCSPSRAAIITGRNHHSVGFGVVGEVATGFPGYDSIIPIDKGTIGTILKENGYATAWFGKDHNTPSYQSSQAGPFNQWPNGMGFDYFYGFVGGDASQWQPNLFRNTTAIYPFRNNPGWNLETAMADEAIHYMKQLKEIAPAKPWFVYYVPGATHAPHHPTPEWIKKISAMHLFDEGWNKVRETIFANQKRLGIMPENAKLTPWPRGRRDCRSGIPSVFERRSSSSSKRISMEPTSPTPTMRSAASSRRSTTSANSTIP